MHELPVINTILNIVLDRARENRVTEIKTIFLKIGALSDLEEEWMQRYFAYLSRGTPAASARLAIERTPARVQCRTCGHCFELDLQSSETETCQSCGHNTYALVSGTGYYLESIEAVEPGQPS